MNIEEQKKHLQLLNCLDGISEEINTTRKDNRDLVLHLRNISDSLDYICTYLGEISVNLKKDKE